MWISNRLVLVGCVGVTTMIRLLNQCLLKEGDVMGTFYVSVTAQITEDYTIQAPSNKHAEEQARHLMLKEYKVQRVYTDGSEPINTGWDAVNTYSDEW